MAKPKSKSAITSQPLAETSAFRRLKESLQPAEAGHIESILERTAKPDKKRSATPFGAGQQVGHNQTAGADAARRNVPRRTGG